MPDVDYLEFPRPAPLTGMVEVNYMVERDFEYQSNDAGLFRKATLTCPGDDGPFCADWLKGVGAYRLNGFPNPHQFPGNEELRCHTVIGHPQGNLKPGPQAVSGDDAILEAHYQTPVFDISGVRNQAFFQTAYPIPWCRVESHDTFEEFPVKGAVLTVDRIFKRRVGITEFIIDRGMISNWLGFYDILKSFRNSVNKYTFFGAAPGTLYFAGSSFKPDWDASGLPVQTFRIVIREREADWNFVPSDTDLGAWIDYHDFDDPPKRNYKYMDWTPIHAFGIL